MTEFSSALVEIRKLAFVARYWPDFTGEDLTAALAEYRRRDRRFGAIAPDALPGAATQI